jgi:light-regulated signal transduction histidine kinase (bacteriophytochrome)
MSQNTDIPTIPEASPDEATPIASLPTEQKVNSHEQRRGDSKSPPRRTASIATSAGPSNANKGQLSPSATDRVFPIRSVVSVDPTPTPSTRQDRFDYFYNASSAAARVRRRSETSGSETSTGPGYSSRRRKPSVDITQNSKGDASNVEQLKTLGQEVGDQHNRKTELRLPAQLFNDIISKGSGDTESISGSTHAASDMPRSEILGSLKSDRSSIEDTGGLVTSRFKHIVSDGGHAIITGRDGDTLQRCEDEPIHIPGAVQGFGLLIALQEEPSTGNLLVRIVSENSKRIIGRSPRQLFALDSFCDILSEEQADNLLDHIDFIREDDADVATNGPEVFTMSIKIPEAKPRKLWCAMHLNNANPGLIICEFELEDDPTNPLVPPNELTPDLPEDTLDSRPSEEEFIESTQSLSRPLRILRSARKRKGEAAAMEVFNIMSQVQEQLAAAPNLDKFLKVLVGVVKELTGFHRVMVYQFDQSWNGKVVTELVDPRATKDLYKGLHFPASDIPKQARDLYRINRVRLLYDRDQETARLVCRTMEDLENPLDLTHSYLRAMSPIHLKYLANMAVRSSMSISINAFDELWGLISCHSYGSRGTRVSFPIRKMCRLVGDSASRNIERLSYASRLQARKLINTAPTQHNPSGYIVASSDDLLKLFNADFGLLSIRDETKILGELEQSQEALAMLEYLRMRRITSVTMSQDITEDFPDLRYPPGFSVIAGMLVVPLTAGGHDFIVFFRKGQLKEVKWAGNPYEKYVREGTEGYLEPRKSFKTWSETVVGKCREWTEEEVETAAVLCLVYGKFIEVWRQKEAALQNSQLTRLLLANSAHEVRTPLNAIINYLEIALEGSLDQETRENLARSHSASKSLIYVINDLLDLTKTEEGGELIKEEIFDLGATLREATDMFVGDAKRKGLVYEIIEHPGVPQSVIGDQRRVRQVISNVTANAIQNTHEGSIKVEMYVAVREGLRVDIEVVVQDTGIGMDPQKLDALFRDLEQVQTEPTGSLEMTLNPKTAITDGKEERRTLGLGLAVVARIIRNMDGQLRLKSEEGTGSRFVVQLPFNLPESDVNLSASPELITNDGTPLTERPSAVDDGEVTLVDREKPRRDSSTQNLTRKNSADSMNSRRSLRSLQSVASSHQSTKSDVDRLIEAIQVPHIIDERPAMGERSQSTKSSRPVLEKRLSFVKSDQPGSPERKRSRSLDEDTNKGLSSELEVSQDTPGEWNIQDSGTPIKPVKIADEAGSPVNVQPKTASGIIGELYDEPKETDEPPTADHMLMLVAEDDPINSKIVKKRLEKYGHEICLTVNGEECATAYRERPGMFDVILMDMQVCITSQM